MNGRVETATFAGGCFWCLEAVFERVRGVSQVVSGYIGGRHPNPSYEAVCSGASGHAEAVRVTYDPDVITYRELLGLFFAFHDPTTMNRQGADVGTQYRSAIFPEDPGQADTARAVIDELTAQHVFDSPIVTKIEPNAPFYPAEPYHQGYYRTNPGQGYCAAVISPKVSKLRKQYASWLKPEFAGTGA